MHNHSSRATKSDRVGMFLDPHTRNRLNKLKAEMALATGKTMSQDEVICVLLDHFAETAPQLDRVVAG